MFKTYEYIEANPIKPVYTQEMKDNGELPSVGMDFISNIEICPEHDGRVTCEAIIKDRIVYLNPDNDVGDEHYETSDNCYVGTKIARCSPIPPTVKLEDGCIYSFTYKQFDAVGFYYDGSFVANKAVGATPEHVKVKATECTNIKKLVEEK